MAHGSPCAIGKKKPMPSNRNNRKRNTPLDLEASLLLEEFEYNFCKYVDTAFPKKFKDSYVRQIMSSLAEASRKALIGFSHDSYIFPREKLDNISNAIGELYYVQTRLNRLNDMDQISDDVKARFDTKLNDIIDGLVRFSSSLRNKISIAGRVSQGTPCGEAGELEGCHTGYGS